MKRILIVLAALALGGCCCPRQDPPWVPHTYSPEGYVQGDHGLPGRACAGLGPTHGASCGAGACGTSP